MSTTTERRAVCRECGNKQEVPVNGQCDWCHSRKLKLADPFEEALRDALASLDMLLQDNERHREQILNAITKVTFALGESP